LISKREKLRRIFGQKEKCRGWLQNRSKRELNALFNIAATLKGEILNSIPDIIWPWPMRQIEGQLLRTVSKWEPNKRQPRGRPKQW